MRLARVAIAALLVVLLWTAWAVPGQYIRLVALREAYRAGESVGITTTAANGGRLAGQVMGFNYAQPPAWYEFVAQCFSGACMIAPALVVLAWLWPLLTGRPPRRTPPSVRATIARHTTAVAVGAIVFGALYVGLRWTLWDHTLVLFEWLGGHVARLGGQVGMGVRGPFYGDTIADDVGNFFSRYGSEIVFGLAACAAGLITHALLQRRSARRAVAQSVCLRCGYALRGLPPSAPCPECGVPRP